MTGAAEAPPRSLGGPEGGVRTCTLFYYIHIYILSVCAEKLQLLQLGLQATPTSRHYIPFS